MNIFVFWEFARMRQRKIKLRRIMQRLETLKTNDMIDLVESLLTITLLKSWKKLNMTRNKKVLFQKL